MRDDEAIEHDRHLRAALRHAPDADAQPPAELSAEILRRARESVGGGRRRWFMPFAMPSLMPWAGGLASLMVATLIGVLWWREPLPPLREQPPALRDTPAADALGKATAPPAEARAPRADTPAVTPAAPEKLRKAARPAATAPAAPTVPEASAAPATPAVPPATTAPAAPAEAAVQEQSRDALGAAAAPHQRAERFAAAADTTATRPRGPAVPPDIDDAARAWLDRLLAIAGTRWQRHDGAWPEGRLQRWPDGGATPRLSVVLTPAGAYWRDHAAGDATWFAPLTPAQRERLGEP